MMRNHKPPRQPLFWAALVFSLGLWTGVRAWRPPSWWVIAILAFVFAASWFLRKRAWLAKAFSLRTWFLLGALLIQVRGQPHGDPRISSLADGREVTLTAHVIREGYARAAGAQQIRESIDVETEEIASQGESWPVRAGVRLSIYEKVEDRAIGSSGHRVIEDQGPLNFNDPMTRSPDDPIPLTYGTRLRIPAKLHPARNYRNPGAFDYEGYLRDNSISVLGSAESKDVERVPGFSGSQIQLWRNRVHASIVAKIHELWPASQASLMDAMVLGEESFLRNATRTEYQRSGTYHVLVVSGMNLSILAFAIFWTLRQFRVDPALAALTTVVVSFAYAFVVGVGPPVWRAALMLATYLGARLLYRERNMMNAIGAAALGVLIADPHALFGASFQLTFLAVFIIAGIGSPILERTTLPYARGLRLLRAKSYDMHVAPELAQFMAYHFHRATTMGMPANMAVIPLTQVLMPAAAAAVGLGYISTALAKPAVWISGLALEGIAGTVHFLGGAQVAGTSIADLRVAMPSLTMILASIAALMMAMLAALIRRTRWTAFASVVLLFGVAVWIAFVPSRPHLRAGVMEMTTI